MESRSPVYSTSSWSLLPSWWYAPPSIEDETTRTDAQRAVSAAQPQTPVRVRVRTPEPDPGPDLRSESGRTKEQQPDHEQPVSSLPRLRKRMALVLTRVSVPSKTVAVEQAASVENCVEPAIAKTIPPEPTVVPKLADDAIIDADEPPLKRARPRQLLEHTPEPTARVDTPVLESSKPVQKPAQPLARKRHRKTTLFPCRYTVTTTLQQHWQPICGTRQCEGKIIIVHTIHKQQPLLLVGQLRFVEYLPNNHQGRLLAPKLAKATKAGLRFHLQQQPGTQSYSLSWNPDMPVFTQPDSELPETYLNHLQRALEHHNF